MLLKTAGGILQDPLRLLAGHFCVRGPLGFLYSSHVEVFEV